MGTPPLPCLFQRLSALNDNDLVGDNYHGDRHSQGPPGWSLPRGCQTPGSDRSPGTLRSRGSAPCPGRVPAPQRRLGPPLRQERGCWAHTSFPGSPCSALQTPINWAANGPWTGHLPTGDERAGNEATPGTGTTATVPTPARLAAKLGWAGLAPSQHPEGQEHPSPEPS